MTRDEEIHPVWIALSIVAVCVGIGFLIYIVTDEYRFKRREAAYFRDMAAAVEKERIEWAKKGLKYDAR